MAQSSLYRMAYEDGKVSYGYPRPNHSLIKEYMDGFIAGKRDKIEFDSHLYDGEFLELWLSQLNFCERIYADAEEGLLRRWDF